MPVAAPLILTGASLLAQGYGMSQQNKASKQSIETAQEVAAYNSAVDLADARQIEIDADENVRNERQDARVYTSRMEAAYAASGVLMSGSPLAAEVTTAGRLEQGILQRRAYAQQESRKREAAARMGILYADSASNAIKVNNSANMLRGGVELLSTVAGAYQSGVFSRAGGAGGGPTGYTGAYSTPGASYAPTSATARLAGMSNYKFNY